MTNLPTMRSSPLQAYMEFAHRAKTTPASDAIRRLRSQVLAHLTKLGMYALPEDWTKVNRFLLQRRICGRLLYMLDAQELQALVRKLRPSETRSPPRPHGLRIQVTPIYIIPGGGPTVVN